MKSANRKTIGEILEKHNLSVDLVHNKSMTERVYQAMEEYASQFKGISKEKIVKDSKDKIDTLIGYLELFNSRYPQLCNELPNVIREAKEFAASLSESDKEISGIPSEGEYAT